MFGSRFTSCGQKYWFDGVVWNQISDSLESLKLLAKIVWNWYKKVNHYLLSGFLFAESVETVASFTNVQMKYPSVMIDGQSVGIAFAGPLALSHEISSVFVLSHEQCFRVLPLHQMKPLVTTKRFSTRLWLRGQWQEWQGW